MAHRYVHSKGYPLFPDRANFVGTLKGSWHDMGKQFGVRSGDAVRCVTDIWWRKQCKLWGKDETLYALALYEKQIQALDPGLIDFMKGIADGASPWLNESPFSQRGDPLYSTNYQRVLAVNIHDEWSMRHPRKFPNGTSTYGGTVKARLASQPHTCSGFSARERATREDETIATQNRHGPYDPRCYQQVYIIQPDDGIACWVLTNCPQVAANQVVNSRGVSIALFAGGTTNQRSLNHNGHAYYAEEFGVPWFHLFLYAGTHAKTAKEAIEILTVGPSEYRKRTGRRSLLRGGGWIFLVSDDQEIAVVEATADRYAIRRPGQFTGPGWCDPGYIVATNHNLCDFSYDAMNRRTAIPMTIFGDGFKRDPSTGKTTGLDNSGIRFWTLMWDINRHYGELDSQTAQRIMSGLHSCDKATGKKVVVATDEGGDSQIWGKACNQGTVSLAAGSTDGKAAVLRGEGTEVHWTMGSPSHWQGDWDAYRFND
jgi:hypothetical protein